jgi:hypothetical protein
MKLRLQSVGTTLAYAYVLRVPIFVWLLMVALPLVAVPRGAALGPLLRGLFDLSDPLEHGYVSDPFVSNTGTRDVTFIEHLIEGASFALVALASWMVAASIGVVARLILRDGADRFDIPPLEMTPDKEGIELALRLLIALPPLFIVGAAAVQSSSTVAPLVMLAGVAAGFGVFFGLSPIQRGLWTRMFTPEGEKRPATAFTKPFHGLLNLFEWLIEHTPDGFVHPQNGKLLSRHVFAFFQMLVSVALYFIVFLLKLDPIDNYVRIPTLCLVLLLAMVACWALSAMSFILDRFRVPVIVVLIAYATAISVFPQGDHFFPSGEIRNRVEPQTPAQVLARRSSQTAIAVSAMGGGIHAGAWVARVLAELQRDSMGCGTDFDQALSVISSVSGGSMGAMYILDAYQDGTLRDETRLATAVKAAEASSLDDVAWALTYPDLLWSIFPFAKSASGSFLTLDRGRALEDSWKRTTRLKSATLNGWRRDVQEKERPAVIFNSTVVETGERLLLGTTTIDGKRAAGRVDFSTDSAYAQADVFVVTAARLSSTFPYVSPPARIDRNSVFDHQFHFVDGGYYDNYGTATLAEWLTKALDDANAALPSRVLLLEIRTFPEDGPQVADGRRGWIFEATHPLLTLAEVRGAAQQSTAEVLADLVQRARPGFVKHQKVSFPSVTYEELDDLSPALSWHLTAGDRKRLRDAWAQEEMKETRRAVHRFLTGQDDASCIK